MQPVNDRPVSVKTIFDQIVKTRIIFFPIPKQRKGNQICQLYKTRGLTVDKNRHLTQVAQHTPLMTSCAEIMSQRLQCSFMNRFVEQNQTSLGVSSAMQTA